MPLYHFQLGQGREERLGKSQSDPSRVVYELYRGDMDFRGANLRIADHPVPRELTPGNAKTGQP
jgi:hypothetical protein